MTKMNALPAATRALLTAIDAWLAATGCAAGELGIIALNHAGFVPLLRKRGTLRPETDAHLRRFMAAFPDRRALPPGRVEALKIAARGGRPWREEATPPPTPTKPRLPAAVVVAARMDGRDLATFVEALIAMGLECWRDDRLAHGEMVP